MKSKLVKPLAIFLSALFIMTLLPNNSVHAAETQIAYGLSDTQSGTKGSYGTDGVGGAIVKGSIYRDSNGTMGYYGAYLRMLDLGKQYTLDETNRMVVWIGLNHAEAAFEYSSDGRNWNTWGSSKYLSNKPEGQIPSEWIDVTHGRSWSNGKTFRYFRLLRTRKLPGMSIDAISVRIFKDVPLTPPDPIIPPDTPDIQAPVAHISAPSEVHTGTPVTVSGYGTDPQGLKIIDYQWTCSTGDTITGTGGTINVSGTASVTLKVKNEKDVWSEPVTAVIGAINHPPTVYLSNPSTVIMGDDVVVNAHGSDIDGDPLYYTWNTPNDFKGSCNSTSGIGYFTSLGNKYFTVTATDTFGESASSSSSVNVIAPTPNVVITKEGTEKENRKITLNAEKFSYGGSKKFPIDWTKTTWEFFDANGNKLLVDNKPSSSTIIKSLDSTTGTKGMNLIVKQQGKYRVRCSVINTAGYTNYMDILLNIIPDIAPIADFDLPSTGIRDINDPSPHGLAQVTTKVSDNSSSSDQDFIAKRMWIACFDSDNDGSYIWVTKNEDGTKKAVPTYERWYVYDLDYNGSTDTQQGISDSLNPHWRYIGNYYDSKSLDINSINCGNLTNVQFKSTSVGRYDFEENIKEEFGKETITELTTVNDRKQANTWGMLN